MLTFSQRPDEPLMCKRDLTAMEASPRAVEQRERMMTAQPARERPKSPCGVPRLCRLRSEGLIDCIIEPQRVRYPANFASRVTGKPGSPTAER